MTSSVPLIDLTAAGDLGSPAREYLVAAVDRACRDVGFFTITNHPISRELQLEMLSAGREFFDQPSAKKAEIAIEQSNHHRGYAGIGAEQLQPDLPGDAKETLDFGIERALDDPGCSPLEGPNQWPDLPGFRDTVERYQAAARETASLLLGVIATALDLPLDFFEPGLAHPLLGSRMVHYPPIPNQQIDKQLGGAHSDYGCLTLLLTDGVPGLQLLRRDDTWVDVGASAGELIVNLGDLLGRWTNDLYRSTKHRVQSPTDRHRYSVPVFVDPGYDTYVEVLDSCIDATRPARYEPVGAGDYLRSRFDDTFAYRQDD
jgi:isopenicillin N synthase-like dioxygenase